MNPCGVLNQKVGKHGRGSRKYQKETQEKRDKQNP